MDKNSKSQTNDKNEVLGIDENNNRTVTNDVRSIRKDLPNIIFLVFLYFLQAVPLGLTGSLPYILSSRKVNYAEQGTFSFAFWPFSLKLLWAPIVDSLFIRKLGRRKTWLVPIQYLLGIYLILWSSYVAKILDDEKSTTPNVNSIYILTGIFLIFTFLAATQDIVVDGWALSLLSSENISWSSTCESVGGTIGWFVGNVLFLVVESADFSNKYIRNNLGFENQNYGLVTIDKFMSFFGTVYLVTTTLILFFKKETSGNHKGEENTENEFSLKESYKLVWKIVCLKPIRKLVFILFTIRLAFAAESMSYLKLIESGVPKEKLGLLAVPLTPLQIFLPFFISKLLSKTSPFKYYTISFIFRSGIIAFFAIWVYMTPLFKETDGTYSFTFYVLTVFFEAIHSMSIYSSYMPIMFFFTQISDKNIGATYLTFLNTVANLARSFTNTSALYIANFLTFKYCTFNEGIDYYTNQNLATNSSTYNVDMISTLNNTYCNKDLHAKSCKEFSGECKVFFDPFYMDTLVFFVFGIFWLIYFRKHLNELESVPKSEWIVYQDKIKLRKNL